MVKVKLRYKSVTGIEKEIAQVLSYKMSEDLKDVKCPHCECDSEVVLYVDNSKMSALRTEILPCCESFKHEIEEKLYLTQPA